MEDGRLSELCVRCSAFKTREVVLGSCEDVDP